MAKKNRLFFYSLSQTLSPAEAQHEPYDDCKKCGRGYAYGDAANVELDALPPGQLPLHRVGDADGVVAYHPQGVGADSPAVDVACADYLHGVALFTDIHAVGHVHAVPLQPVDVEGVGAHRLHRHVLHAPARAYCRRQQNDNCKQLYQSHSLSGYVLSTWRRLRPSGR